MTISSNGNRCIKTTSTSRLDLDHAHRYPEKSLKVSVPPNCDRHIALDLW